jgi:hypothetical protein
MDRCLLSIGDNLLCKKEIITNTTNTKVFYEVGSKYTVSSVVSGGISNLCFVGIRICSDLSYNKSFYFNLDRNVVGYCYLWDYFDKNDYIRRKRKEKLDNIF